MLFIGFPCTAGPMETRIPGFSSALGILLLFVFFSRTEAMFNPESFQRKLVALYKVLDYMNNRPQQMNVDATFGVTLCEANLMAALSHRNAQYLDHKFLNALNKIVALSDLTRKNLMNNVAPTNEIEHILQSGLNNPALWIKSVSWREIFPRTRLTSRQRLNYSRAIKSVWHGAPNETESDECLVKIVRSGSNRECQIPETCIEILMRNDGAAGYSLTHRLLIVQVAEALRCQKIKSIPLSYLVPAYCARIHQDLVVYEAWDFPTVTKDLMLEQIVLCGMEGYHEFVDKHYENLMLSWPHSSGCFSFHKFPVEHRIARRSSTQTDFRCESHTTGLAAAAIALFIRENVENALVQS